jgi:hypothetical protein
MMVALMGTAVQGRRVRSNAQEMPKRQSLYDLLTPSEAWASPDKQQQVRDDRGRTRITSFVEAPSQEQVMDASATVDALMSDPQILAKLEEFEELLEENPQFLEELEEKLADPSLQQQAKLVQEQMEDMEVGSSSLLQVGEESDDTPYWKAMAANLLMSNPDAALQLQAPTSGSRRAAMKNAAATLAGLAAVAAGADKASAKAGEFGKQSLFGVNPMSSPYQEGGPKAGEFATFGYKRSEGPILAAGYEKDVSREKASFLESARRVESLQPKIEKQEWWFVRDELRVQAYNMRSSMLALNKVNAKPAEVGKLYKDFWQTVESFDLACRRKKPEVAAARYKDVITALQTYKAAAAS